MSLSTKDFMKIEDAPIQKVTTNESSRQIQDMSQTIDLFRKYLISKARHSIKGKTNMDESETIIKKRSPQRALMPPMPGCNHRRRASFLERRLLPGIGLDTMQSSSADEKPSKGQLTIFYAGTINVYDNVPIEKAQAIMLLAGESSLSRPKSKEMSKTDAKTADFPVSFDSLACNLTGPDLLIARKLSIQHFLERRRHRIINRSPYSSSGKNQKGHNETKPHKGSSQIQSTSLRHFLRV
ncbi:hypothetical protein SLA2020_489110 [Shorea laevis]